MAYHDGFSTSGSIVVAGPKAEEKARAAANAISARMQTAGFDLDQFHLECLGAGDSLPGMDLWAESPREIVLKIAARDARREAIERLTRELAPLVTSGPPGVTGYTGSRARVQPVLAYWPTTVGRERVNSQVEVRAAQEWAK